MNQQITIYIDTRTHTRIKILVDCHGREVITLETVPATVIPGVAMFTSR